MQVVQGAAGGELILLPDGEGFVFLGEAGFYLAEGLYLL